MSLSWDLVDPAEEFEQKFGGLSKRAKKREGVQTAPDEWFVAGNEKLGDSYDEYHVKFSDGKYHCSCQRHQGGEYRKMCSHMLYVIFARRGMLDMETLPEVEVEPVVPLPRDIPIYVDQGQEPTAKTRAALDEAFGVNPPLPEWVQLLRLHQWEALEEIVHHFEQGKKAVFLDAPTGAGKSLLGELVRRRLSPNRGVYTCSTKTLQRQVEKDFPYAKVIQGRANYSTADHPGSDMFTADICDQAKRTFPVCKKDAGTYPQLEEGDEFQHCSYCHPVSHCPYRLARRDAEKPGLVVANVAYLTTVMNTSGFLSEEPFIVVDEADTLEDELMRHIQVEFTPRLMKKLGIGLPEKKTVHDAWAPWLRNVAVPALEWQLQHALPSFANADPDTRRTIIRYRRLLDRIDNIIDSIDEDWIMTGYEYGAVIFKPVRIGELGRPYLWDHNDRWLLMSATIISAEQMAFDLGLTNDEWASVSTPSSFDPDRRPIYVEQVASVTNKTKDTAWPKIASRIKEICADHPDEPILIHTVSYALAKVITQAVGKRAITYTNARSRDGALSKFKNSSNGVLVASSFDRGIDLPYDLCRVVVVAKIPYPNLGDKQVAKRLYSKGGKGWYRMQTCRTLVQMTGRAMRFEDDSCEVYVLDAQFEGRIWNESRRMLPEWWTDALKFGKEAERHRTYVRNR